MMNPVDIIAEFYDPGSKTFNILIQHGRLVAKKAVDAAKKAAYLNPDICFIMEAAMLHDIGIFLTDTPELGCTGKHPYVCHGYLGRELLEKKGFFKHALVCERHVGTGISLKDIKRYDLPLPERDMLPLSIEEQIICYADKFFSKNNDTPAKQQTVREKSIEDIKRSLLPYGHDKVMQFQTWVDLFEQTLV